MFDTVNFWIDKGNMAEGDPFSVLPYLCSVVEQMAGTDYSCSGKLGDYTVCCYDKGISLKGSLANYYLSSNSCTLTRKTTIEALQKMSDELHLDMMAANVTRVDVSTVIPTKRPPADYFNSLGDKPRFVRVQATKDTLYYNQRTKQLAFYDKTKEATAKAILIPQTLQRCNLLRYEMRFLRRLKKLCKMETSIKGATLTNSNFYYSIIQTWKKEFDTIKKNNPIRPMTDNIKTPKEAQEALFAILLQQNGQICIDEFLNELKAKKVFPTPEYYSRLKAKLYKIMQAAKEEKSELIKELETAIADIANYAR